MTLAEQQRHERIIRGRQMEAVALWPQSEQIALARQIMLDVVSDGYVRQPARNAAQIAADAIDETEAEMGWRSVRSVRS